jgi:minor histocompatibility antigen H13
MKDASLFPIYGSVVLFSLYIVFKLFNPDTLKLIFSLYFAFLGFLCLVNIIETELDLLYPKKKEQYIVQKKFEWNFIKKKTLSLEFSQLNLISFSIAIVPMVLYIMTKHWLLNNIFGIAFSITGISSLNLPNFKVGFILLWGLFLYDIFWVYGTDVMVSVAQNIDAPIKLSFPADLSATPPKFSMLGLGDIVIPGIFVALCLKFDIDTGVSLKKKANEISQGYFHWCFAGYTLGIITTFATMVVFEHAQPALLFLVPGCCFSILLRAFKHGEIEKLKNYEENPEKTEKKPEELKGN